MGFSSNPDRIRQLRRASIYLFIGLMGLVCCGVIYSLVTQYVFWTGVTTNNGQWIRLAVRFGANSKATDDGQTALSCAVQAGRVEAVRALLSAGADPNDTDRATGTSVLLDAASEGQSEIVILLIEAGADPNRRNMYGYTALGIALQHNNKELSDMLTRSGAHQ